MDFRLSWEQEELVKQVDAFCQKEIEPVVDEYDRKKILRDPSLLKEFFRKLQPFGAICGSLPQKYGGMDLDYISTGLVYQKIAEYWGSFWGTCSLQSGAGRLLAEVENEAVKEKYLPQVCRGELLLCAGITEPDVGSNPAEIKTTLEKTSGGYLLNGTKTWISNGSVSDLAIVFASVDRSLGAKGLAAVLVDRKESPYTVRELEKLGLRSFPTAELSFEDTFVPEENMVVAPGKGLKVTMRGFELARVMMGVGAVGISTAAINLAVDYARQREQFGRKIGSFQLVQAMIADMQARTEAAALLTYRALWMMDQGMRCESESAIVKFYSTEAAVKTTSTCIQILGAYGLSEEYRAERYFRDARALTIPDGTTQIQKMIVGREALGLSAFV